MLIGKGMWMGGLFIFIFLTFGAFFYTIVGDVILFATNPTSSHLYAIFFDSGVLVAASQWVIKNAIISLANGVGSSQPLYGDFLLRAIFAGTMLTLLMIVLVYFGISNTIGRHFKQGFMGWLGIVAVSVLIVGGIQVVATLGMTGDWIWPYEGFIELYKNGEVISDAFFETSKNIGQDSLFDFPRT